MDSPNLGATTAALCSEEARRRTRSFTKIQASLEELPNRSIHQPDPGSYEVVSSVSPRSSTPAYMFPRYFWDRYAVQGVGDGSSLYIARRLEQGSTGGLCAVKCLGSSVNGYNNRGVKSPLEKVLEVLDQLVECQTSPSFSAQPRESTSELVSQGGSVFLQKIYDIFCGDGRVYVVHSYCERNLADPATAAWFRLPVLAESSGSPNFLLDPDGTFQRQTERIYQDVMHSLRLLAAELILGILFLHNLGIVHQDIKPANIMVTPSGHIQISDYGAANLLPKLAPGLVDLSDLGSAHSSVASSPVSEIGERLSCTRKFGLLVVGLDEVITFTPRYAAPELLEHDERGLIVYDERVDWWSFGFVLGELSCGSEYSNFAEFEAEDDEGFCQFITQLLVTDPSERLDGPATRDHHFLGLGRQTWDEILELRHPPCSTTIELGSQLELGDSGSTISIPPKERQKSPQGSIKDVFRSPLADRSHGILFESEDQESDIQPFPSTASLYKYYHNWPGCQTGREVMPQIVMLSEDPNDSGLALQATPILPAGGGVGRNGDGGDENSRETKELEETEYLYSPLAGRCEEHGLGEDWVNMTMDDMVVLSLLQARDDVNAQLAEHWRACKIRVKIRPRKARIIAKASKRMVKLVSEYIYAAVRCR